MKTWQKLKRNPSLFKKYFIREQVFRATRSFFELEHFHEVETPLLVANPLAESYLEIFETDVLDRHRNVQKGYLSTSPENSLKKLLVAGIGDCYSLTKSFRNMETYSLTHNPEFTILEWYRVGVGYEKIMEDCEQLFLSIYKTLVADSNGESTQCQLEYQGHTIDLSAPWERLTMKQAFQKWANVDFDRFLDEKQARIIAREKGYSVEEKNTWEELYNQIFLNEVEPNLGYKKPTILYEFPGSMGALARKKPSDPRYSERFEFYIAGIELGDCYSELTNPTEQELRFNHELEEIKRLGKTSYEYDRDFIDALKEGLPQCSGMAIGMDRVIMVFGNVRDIAETLFFPGKEMFHSE